MPSSTSPTVVPLSTRVKMEDRKRPAVNGTDDIAPPSKRQAINGSGKSKEDNDAKDEAWVEVSFRSLQHPNIIVDLLFRLWPHHDFYR
jgi:hypothetical protein